MPGTSQTVFQIESGLNPNGSALWRGEKQRLNWGAQRGLNP